MRKYKSSGSSIFLMEIILNILLFSILLCISLQFLMKAHTLTNKTTRLERAVTACANVASIYESGDGSFASLQQEFPHCMNYGDFLIIYLDADFLSCEPDDMKYSVVVEFQNDGSVDGLAQVDIRCDFESDTIYEISAGKYHPRTASQKGGAAHE